MGENKISNLKSQIEQFVRQKNSIIQLENKKKQINKEVNDSKEDLNSFSYIENRIYEDVLKEIEGKEKEIRETSEEINSREIKLRSEIETKKREIIDNLEIVIDDNKKQSLADIKQEKLELEGKLELNNVTKEDFVQMEPQRQREVRIAKERYLINKKRIKNLSNSIEFLELFKKQKPEDVYLELNDLTKEVNSRLSYDNIQDIFKEEKEQEKTTKETTLTQIENKETRKIQQKQDLDKKIEEIFIDEYNNEVDIKRDGDKNLKTVKQSITEILSNRKQIFKDNDIDDKCAELSNSRIKRFLLKRKLNPIIVKVLGDNNEKEAVQEYIKSVYMGRQTKFKLVHDLRESSLTGFKKMMMKRFAKIEENELDADVLRKQKNIKLLRENKIEEKTFTDGLKVDDETRQTLESISSKANDNIEKSESYDREENVI